MFSEAFVCSQGVGRPPPLERDPPLDGDVPLDRDFPGRKSPCEQRPLPPHLKNSNELKN